MNRLPTPRLAVLILVPIALAAGFDGETRAQTYTVCDQGCGHTTIQAAVDAAPERPARHGERRKHAADDRETVEHPGERSRGQVVGEGVGNESVTVR